MEGEGKRKRNRQKCRSLDQIVRSYARQNMMNDEQKSIMSSHESRPVDSASKLRQGNKNEKQNKVNKFIFFLPPSDLFEEIEEEEVEEEEENERQKHFCTVKYQAKDFDGGGGREEDV